MNRARLFTAGRLRLPRNTRLDLDGFKPVNDLFGHHVGDQALCDIAASLSKAVRPDDTVARFAGDEFLVIADRVADDAVTEMAERLRNAAEWTVQRDRQVLRVGASVGTATATPGTTTADKLIQQADKAMYSDKSRRAPS